MVTTASNALSSTESRSIRGILARREDGKMGRRSPFAMGRDYSVATTACRGRPLFAEGPERIDIGRATGSDACGRKDDDGDAENAARDREAVCRANTEQKAAHRATGGGREPETDDDACGGRVEDLPQGKCRDAAA